MSELERDFDLDWEGRGCKVAVLGAKPSREVGRRLTNIAGTALKEAAASGRAEGEGLEIVAIGAALELVDESTLDWLTATFARTTTVEAEAGSNKWVNGLECQEAAFKGPAGLRRWFRWLSFCVDMSCGDFFAELRALQVARKPAKVAPRSPSPNT